MTSGAILNFGDLAKPAEALINRISDAVGGIAKPWQIKRIARAEGEAALIKATTELKLSEIQVRAFERLAREEIRNQENIEDISYKSLEYLNADANPDLIEEDWITNFFASARKISNENIQDIWSKILAQEANNPKSIPKSTIKVLEKIGPNEAEIFQGLLSLSKRVGDMLIPFIYGWNHDLLIKNNLNYDMLSHLDDIGIITFYNNSNHFIENPEKIYPVYIGGVLHRLYSNSYKIDVGNVRLSFAGRIIARSIVFEQDDQLDNYLRESWAKKAIDLEVV